MHEYQFLEHDCPKCKEVQCVNEITQHIPYWDYKELCRCDECHTTFEIDFSADFDGENYVDDSSVGEELKVFIVKNNIFRGKLLKSRAVKQIVGELNEGTQVWESSPEKALKRVTEYHRLNPFYFIARVVNEQYGYA